MIEEILREAWDFFSDNWGWFVGGGAAAFYGYHKIYGATRPVVEGTIAEVHFDHLEPGRVKLATKGGDMTLLVDRWTEMAYSDRFEKGNTIRVKVKEKEGDVRNLYDIL